MSITENIQQTILIVSGRNSFNAVRADCTNPNHKQNQTDYWL